MDRYLRASILCFIFFGIMLWLFLTMGCAGVEIVGVCRHEATYAISVMGEKYPVRVAYGSLQKGQDLYNHSQAQVWQTGEWKWLCVDYPFVFICPENRNFSAKQFYVPWVWLNYYVLPNMKAD